MLVELLLAVCLVAGLLAAGLQLFAGMLETQSSIDSELGSQPEAQRVLTRIREAVAGTAHLHIPNGRRRSAPVLVLSANVDNDGDGRVDEDPSTILFSGGHGAPGLDDDGDGLVDEGPLGDDDEDGLVDEDPRNGLDDDGDGSIDEDPPSDANGDGYAGVRRIDDDGDGTRDEGSTADDDEDGVRDEDGPDLRVFRFDADQHALFEERPGPVNVLLLPQVQDFEAIYLTGAGGEPLVEIRLRVGSGDGRDDALLTTRVYPANQVARHGLTLP